MDETLRQRAKQICYGIIYGIGSQTLSEQIEMDESEAVILIENFKNQYTGMLDLFLSNLIAFTLNYRNFQKLKNILTKLLTIAKKEDTYLLFWAAVGIYLPLMTRIR